jgi:cyclopropane-fatty-acyl-phospholipid synthase
LGAAGRIDSFRRLLAHVRERLALDVGFALWDGSTVPGDLAPDAFAVAFADEGAVAALVRRPKLETLANLWVTARIDIRNGSLFDLVARRPKAGTKTSLKSLDRWLVAGTVLKFLPVARGGPWPLETTQAYRQSDGSTVENKKNIQFHYDVSNAFYQLFLDAEMLYTCAYFARPENDLDTAQRDKMEMICRKLRLKPGETLLDLGCGWGGLVCHAVRHHGVAAYGVTLSEAQASYAREKIARLGLGDRALVECKDYSAVEGSYDKIAAICILEHLGRNNHDRFYRTVFRTLKPGGLFLNQSITRPAKRSDRAFNRKSRDYAALMKYIFPGGEVDYIGRTLANLERYGFEVHDVEGWRENYQRTCRLWHDRLLANRAAAEGEAGRETTRLWLLYLAGCAIGFERGRALLFQTLASKRGRNASSLPPTRADLYR